LTSKQGDIFDILVGAVKELQALVIQRGEDNAAGEEEEA
jgi:hypothetical protein